MYIPVEAATVGGTPSPIKTGLNTSGPPSPSALARPPPIEAAINYKIVLRFNEISCLFQPIFVFFFKISSF